MKVYRVEVNSNGWKYNSVSTAGDIEDATQSAYLAVEKFGDFEEWEMNIYTVNVL